MNRKATQLGGFFIGRADGYTVQDKHSTGGKT